MNTYIHKFLSNITRIIIICSVVLGICSCSEPKEYNWTLPEGFPKPRVPNDNPMSDAKVELGRALFYEPALSGNRAMSCATCHQIQHGFSEPKVLSSGATGEVLKRNALALLNVAYNSNFTWAHDGLHSIEQQMLIPLFADSPVEMGITGKQNEVLARFDTQDYRALFTAAFGDEQINYDRIVKATASFVRSIVSFNSKFDDYAYRQIDSALNESELRGMELFFSERLECFHCHGGFNFTQSSQHELQPLDLRPFHNTGLYNEDAKGAYPNRDRGLIDITLQEIDMGRFRAPTLRNIALTPPYMHDGSIETLPNVITFYANGGRGAGINNPYKSQFVRGFTLSPQEQEDLLAFLHSLTDDSVAQNSAFHAPVYPPQVN